MTASRICVVGSLGCQDGGASSDSQLAPPCQLAALRTCSAKNFVCCDFDRSNIASTRVQDSGCSCNRFSTASAPTRCEVDTPQGRALVVRPSDDCPQKIEISASVLPAKQRPIREWQRRRVRGRLRGVFPHCTTCIDFHTDAKKAPKLRQQAEVHYAALDDALPAATCAASRFERAAGRAVGQHQGTQR